MGKTRCIRVLSYINPESVLIAHDNQIERAVWICHDRDIDLDTGELKALHYHVNIRLKSSRVVGEIARWFVDEENQSSGHDDTGTFSSAIEYYKHTNYPEKYQYSDCDIHYFKCTANDCIVVNDNDDIALAVISDMMEHKSLVDLVRKYGSKFVHHYSQYRLIVGDILGQKYAVISLKEQFAPATPPDNAIEISAERFNTLFKD